MRRLTFHVPGQPQGKGRARFARRGAHMHAYTPDKTVAYEGLIAFAAQQAMTAEGCSQFAGAVDVTVTAVFQIPKSWPKWRKQNAVLRVDWHTSKPDADNVLKAIGDGLNNIVWADDTQIARCTMQKVYGDTPGLTVTVAEIG